MMSHTKEIYAPKEYLGQMKPSQIKTNRSYNSNPESKYVHSSYNQ